MTPTQSAALTAIESPDAMRALLYAAWMGTQTYLIEGKPFIDRQFAALAAAGG